MVSKNEIDIKSPSFWRQATSLIAKFKKKKQELDKLFKQMAKAQSFPAFLWESFPDFFNPDSQASVNNSLRLTPVCK